MLRLGIGIEQVEKFLRQKYGQDVVLLNDKPSFVSQGKIYLSTGQYLSEKLLGSINLLGFVYIDSQVHLSDFTSNKRLYSFAREIIASCSPDEIIFQTAFTNNEAIKSLNFPYSQFYIKELSSRQEFGYPPFSTAVKLVFDHHDCDVAEREAHELYKKIVQANNKLKISEPFLTYRQKVRNRYRYQIVIFFANFEEENQIIKNVPEYWAIDKEPVNVL
jgi:primosomal protein N' (replication factor Y)